MNSQEAFDERNEVVRQIRDKEKQLKSLNRILREDLRSAVMDHNLLSDYEWVLADECGYPGKLQFVTPVKRGDEWKLMNLIPVDDFQPFKIAKGLEISKFPPMRDPGHMFLIIDYEVAKTWIEKLNLKPGGDFDTAIRDRRKNIDTVSYEISVISWLQTRSEQ
jgi:hypothetical protein